MSQPQPLEEFPVAPLAGSPIAESYQDEELLADTISRWRGCRPELSASLPSFSAAGASDREKALENFLVSLTDETKRLPRSEGERQGVLDRLFRGFSRLALSALGWEQRQLDYVQTQGFMDVAVQFSREARCTWPGISGAEIFQAGRNVWAMNNWQDVDSCYGTPPEALSTRCRGQGVVIFYGMAKPVRAPQIGPARSY